VKYVAIRAISAISEKREPSSSPMGPEATLSIFSDRILDSSVDRANPNFAVAHAAKIWIVENQVAELRSRLNEICARKALDLVVKVVKTNEFAQHDSRVVETERLIEIACK
jgi:hypothetical protein